MKSVFELYPEVILVDATYKVNNLRMPLYLMMCIDANGHGEIVLMFLTMMKTLTYYSLLLYFSYYDYYHCRFVSKQLKLKVA